MEKRVKIFDEEELSDLECSINNFLRSTKGAVKDIRYQLFDSNEGIRYATALVIYTPDKEEYEKKDATANQNEKSDGRIQGKITPFWFLGRPACKV